MTGRRGSPARALWLALLLCVTLAACGGGGSGDSSTGPATTSGGGSPNNPTTSSVVQSTTPNQVTVSVGPLATRTPNMLTTSVTVCVPNTSTCATIDNVQVDTGSAGLRLLASALPSSITLPAVNAGSGTNVAGECLVFGSGYTWGAVRLADVKLASETAASLPIQVIADPSVPSTAPSSCSNASAIAMNDASSLHVNGIIGVGLFNADCGASCANMAITPWYYACASGTCNPSTQPLAHQVANPVAAFATDNNGVEITLPTVGDNGAASITGTLTFGIGTQANNVLGAATVLHANKSTGYVSTTTSDGTVYARSYLDSGSNAFFFASSTTTLCSGVWFCPSSPLSFGATIKGTDGVAASTSFTVANAQTLLNTGNWAYSNLAAYNGSAFGWGLPFFFGKSVFTAIEGQLTSAGNGPFFAF
ncbi:DUF3443 domain-containing protein [Paraburkholderia dinghuensis]|uniref:DUF3443 domain-containing protein n=1 Tax=Paraburkholderia dinghuensis TaxID=2305225 RepID=A0A3N6N9P1_9BURK|nr:DUF3443 domain-containing protein [Paraburkholderia dinghuensis]RQH07751.1 DUF3443 domain-containing protein [Paraburkholderia dinghuensis]